MYFVPFFEKCGDVAERETRMVTIPVAHTDLPAGAYVFVENYCNDSSCDCRKVMVNIVDAHNPARVLATIGYGWESASWYTKWIGGDAKMGEMMTGSYLEPGGMQSEYMHAFLELWERVAVNDEKYISRIKEHYRLFKGKRK